MAAKAERTALVSDPVPRVISEGTKNRIKK